VQPLPPDLTWHNEGWKGALLMYQSLVEADDPQAKLLGGLHAVYQAGTRFLK
jgi:hypothetical protein